MISKRRRKKRTNNVEEKENEGKKEMEEISKETNIQKEEKK